MVGAEMTKRYAIVKDGKVVNIAMATPEFASEQGWIDLPDGVGIGWSFNNGTPIPPARDLNAEWNAIRQQRNELLFQSDWSQGADAPQSIKDKWFPYRQALRDIPQTFADPKDVVWPTQPE